MVSTETIRTEQMNSIELLRDLGSKYSARILEATTEPRTGHELSTELGIPIATCYRRIDELTNTDLLETYDTTVTAANRESKVYRRSVDGIHIRFDGTIDVDLEPRSDVTTKIDSAWEQLVQ